MFKRVERKRKRREEEELGLDEDANEIIGLNDTDTDESDSGSEHEGLPSNGSESDADVSEDTDQEAGVSSPSGDEEPPISVAEALKDPIYLVSLDPVIYGCVVCKGKLIKNSGMSAAHKNANAHKRRFDHFRKFAADAVPHNSAWVLVKSIRSVSSVQKTESQELSKRALKRQVKQAAIHEKRKRHRKVKAKAIAKKASKRLSIADEINSAVPSKVDLQGSSLTRKESGETLKKRKMDSKVTTIMETGDTAAKSVPRRKTSAGSIKPGPKSKPKSTGKDKDRRNLVAV